MTDREQYAPGPASGVHIQKDRGQNGEEKWTLVLVRELRHSPKKVWQAITDPAHLREWAPFDADVSMDRVGTTVKLTAVGAPTPNISETTVTRADAPNVLEYRWGGNDIRWELEASGSGTRLTLWHNIDRRFIAMGAAGWHICFDVMDRMLNGTPIGRMVGGGAMKFGWQRLHAEYKKLLGTTIAKKQRQELLMALKTRFEKNMPRHKGLEWNAVEAKLEENAEKLWSLSEMERTGGEPDVVGVDKKTGEYIFYDCSSESPKGRRSICYDREALESRKEHKPANNAIEMAAAMGIELLMEEQYRELQKLGEFDTKTSSWVKTPSAIRQLGGALFCDRRFNTVFIYHNGAESYYAARGFRGELRV